ncbi:MAG TPA: platelet-activating factor acetylhydrolase IB subunit [Planctomycetota bacterium]|nr:platelet-activating factor acetylhydrolase IB subunit [Planctomycetota bacterium]
MTALAALLVMSLLTQDVDATKPVPRDAGWTKRHEGFVEIAKKGGVDFLLMGDSITDGWRGKGKTVYAENFEPLKAANFGIGGDRTQHVLWRLQNGELDGITPKLCMLMIGTNNGKDSAEDVAAGITAIVKELQKKSPTTKVLLLAIFPRGEKPNPGREKNDKVNTMIAKLDDGGKTVKYLDIGGKFLAEDKSISKDIMPDFLHLTEAGYKLWADAVLPTVKEMLAAK